MPLLGLTPEEMDTLAARFDERSAHVSDTRHQITSLVASTSWTGRRADQFRDDWSSRFAPALDELARALGEHAGYVRRVTDQTRQALS